MNQLTSSILYSLFTERRGENWVFSPASYLEAMSLLSLCIKGENLSELIAVAPDIGEAQAKDLDVSNYLLYAAEYASAMDSETKRSLVNRGAALLGFSDPGHAVATVNALAERDTHGKITGLLQPSDVDDLTKFIILNCVYFKQSWLRPFNEGWQHVPFYGATKTSQVRYLHHRIVGQRYHEDETCDIVELPYKDSNLACYVIVPRTSLFDLFGDLKTCLAKIGRVKAGLDVDLVVPPFKTETTIRNLGGLTAAAGVRRIFDWNREWSLVDWSLLKPEAVMAVRRIIQKAYIDFTKDGTEVAAATAVICAVTGCLMRTPENLPPVKYVRADKPFLYVLADRDDHKPLFVGVVNEVPDSPARVTEDGRAYLIVDNCPSGIKYL